MKDAALTEADDTDEPLGATPETDAQKFRAWSVGDKDVFVVPLDFARQLERQRDAKRLHLKAQAAICAELQRERDLKTLEANMLRKELGEAWGVANADKERAETAEAELSALKRDIARHIEIASQEATARIEAEDELAAAKRDADKDAMIGWFANAIMAGYDTAQHRASAPSPSGDAAKPAVAQEPDQTRDAIDLEWNKVVDRTEAMQPQSPPMEAMTTDAWIPWSGGKNPYPGVEVKLRDGRTMVGWPDSFSWSVGDSSCDIVAYRNLPCRNTLRPEGDK